MSTHLYCLREFRQIWSFMKNKPKIYWFISNLFRRNVIVNLDVRIADQDGPNGEILVGIKTVKKPGCGSGQSLGVFLRFQRNSTMLKVSTDVGE